jgi:hypothetical protein
MHRFTVPVALALLSLAGVSCSTQAPPIAAADRSGTVTGELPKGPALGGVSDAEPGTTDYDMQVWKALLRDHTKIRRTVRHIDRGVEAQTESDDPRIAALIKDHVLAMKDRIRDGYPVRGWDPVFRELFKRHHLIRIDVVLTEKGVKIVETSDDPETVRLMRSHAAGVSDFVKEGFAIMDRETPYIDER